MGGQRYQMLRLFTHEGKEDYCNTKNLLVKKLNFYEHQPNKLKQMTGDGTYRRSVDSPIKRTRQEKIKRVVSSVQKLR